MKRTGLVVISFFVLGALQACSRGGSSGNAGAAGASDSNGGDEGASAGSPGSAGKSATDAGTTGMSDAGAPSVDPGGPGTSEAGAPADAGAGPGPTDSNDPTQPDYPFDLDSAAAALGGTVAAQHEALDALTVEYSLVGSTSTALLDRTEWTTAAEAEFECSRGALGGTQLVGPDRILFVASAADWLAFGTACTKITVSAGGQYSAALTRAFAQTVFGAP